MCRPLLTQSTSGRWTLSRTAWRRRRAGPWSLMVSCWRPEPFTGVSRHRWGSDGSGWLLGISRTTGGRSARGMQEVAAASGVSAPTSNATSGNAASGGVWAGSGLSLTAITDAELTSLEGSVICQFLFKADRATQRSSLDEIAVSFWRRS